MLTVLVINQVLISICSLVFSASNKVEISKQQALRYRNKKIAVAGLVLGLLQMWLWIFYSTFVAHQWQFAALSIVPFFVMSFEKTLRKKTALAVPSIDAEIGERLRVGGRMFRLTMMTSDRSDSMTLSFTDERHD